MNDQSGHDDHSQTEKAQRIAYLISAYLRKTISSTEHDELDEWVGASDENMRLFEELTDESKMQSALDFLKEADTDKSLKKIKSNLEFAKYYSPRPLFSRSWHYAVAACLLLVIGISAFLVYKNSTEKPKQQLAVTAPTTPQDLQPGSADKAILTLDDGSTIVLDQAKDGKLASQGTSEVVKQNGQINYSKANGIPVTVSYNTVTTPRGGSYPITLSDGTKIWLNAASSIRFPTVFTGKERRVAITGEAYFEVAKNASMPFKVDIKDKNATVEVLGTHFNINAYDNEPVIKTTLLEGAVKVDANSKTSFLKPGQQAQISTTDIKTLSNIDVDFVMAWKNGMFHFSNTDLRTIMRQMSRWYDVDIEFDTDVNPSYTSLLSRNIPASKIFEVLEESGGVHFKIDGKKIKVLP